MHDAIKAVELADVNDLHTLTPEPKDDTDNSQVRQRDDKLIIAQLIGKLSITPPTGKDFSRIQDLQEIKGKS